MRLGWIDFSERDRKRALDVINSLEEPGAVDELGIGVIRDAFANRFFPGTSTVQTRAKYFFLCPYIIEEVCRNTKATSAKQAIDEINQSEKQCAMAMISNAESPIGIIGSRILPSRWVARKPYDIYWNGIKTYGILKEDVSIGDCVRYAIDVKSKASNSIKGKAMEDNDNPGDDNDAGSEKKVLFWKLPAHQGWKENLSIDLTEDEADFLEERITNSCRGSLLEIILTNRVDIRIIDSFDILCERVDPYINEELRDELKLACQFNRFVYCARTLYNKFLLGDDAVEKQWKEIEDNLMEYVNVDINRVYHTLHIWKYDRLRRFLIDLKRSVIEKDLDKVRTILITQEKRIKGASRAKLLNADKYHDWVGGAYLDYRYYSVKNLIADIYNIQDAKSEK